MSQVQLFLSTVSAEFLSYRDALRPKLQRPNVTIHVQEDFIPTGTETLDKLDLYIRDCDAIVHLVGDRTGAWAEAPTLQTVKARYPDLVERLPVLKHSIETGEPPLSFTQWEAYLAVYHRKPLVIAVAAPRAPRDGNLAIDPQLRAAQQAHLERLRQLGRYPEITFTDKNDLIAEVLCSTVLDLLVKAESDPPPALKMGFYQSFLGSLLGQTYVFIGLLAVYFATVAFLYSYAKTPLEMFQKDYGLLFWSVLAAPLACILLFQVLPTALRALRERRMKAMAIEGTPKPGYFRLQPYVAADREMFNRLDGADAEILKWLKSTKSSLLYLSGASGVGKSSLLAADLLPKLRVEGWAVVEARLFGDPVERLRKAVRNSEGLFARKPSANLPLRDLLLKATEAHARKDATPFLLVIDQFEEFLILHSGPERVAFTTFLVDLSKNPIGGLMLLLVFRSDYRPLVFKLDLPPLVAGQNWQELAGYDRDEATTLLQSGGRELSTTALDRLFRGLDRIEEARGLYRPIALNMVGLVLERMGRALDRDPAQLIQSYLTGCLTEGASRDFAKPVLTNMITDAGTKEPQTEAALAKLTRFEPWQVKSTLAELAGQGLVRRLEGAVPEWEIAHDFLARIIGRLIGRLKPTLIGRIRPLVAPIVLLGWTIALAAAAAVALPGWQYKRDLTAWRLPTALYDQSNQFTSLSIENRLLTNLGWLRCRYNTLMLNISNADDIEGLRGCNKLGSLTIALPSNVGSLDALKDLKGLTNLTLGGNVGRLDALKDLKGLTNLTLNLGSNFGSLDALKDLKGLTNLTLNLGGNVGTFDALKDLKGLTNLTLNLGGNFGSLDALKDLKGLTNLTLNLGSNFGSLDALKDLKSLTNLTLNLGSNFGR
jgi:hypothetical protein